LSEAAFSRLEGADDRGSDSRTVVAAVRKIAKEHQVDISQIHGTGIAGRVTKTTILAFVGQQGPDGRDRLEGRPIRKGRSGRWGKRPAPPITAAPQFKPGASDHVEKMSVMRKRIAEHIVMSRRTSAHVHSVFEVDFGRLAKIREAKKAEFERAGAKLTYMSFINQAAVDALRAVPIVNASVERRHHRLSQGHHRASPWRSTGV